LKDPMEDAVKVAIKAGGAETKTKTSATQGALSAPAPGSGKPPAGQAPKSP
jgi:hypothetical protein